MSNFSVNENSEIYYQHTYWNDLDVVFRALNERVSGDPDRFWFDRFSDDVGGRTFKRALILNCGNGHVERSLLQNGIISEAVGIDYSDDLLDEARREAEREGLPCRYHQMDVNTAAFPDDEFDLIVNFAAAHHIARIDKVFRAMCELLPDDGWFVSHDYVGPHRNQYGYEMWNAAHQVNRTLPEDLRQDMRYPHLPTMLVTDPTEAIHSELILDTTHRYFDVEAFTPLGGAIGYHLLTHNGPLLNAEPGRRDVAANRVMAADAEYLAAHPGSTLFAYFLGRPRKDVLTRTDDLARWSAEEDDREDRAVCNGGEYYPHTALQDLHLHLEDLRMLADPTNELVAARAAIVELENTFPLPQWRRMTSSRPANWVRDHPLVERTARAGLARVRARFG